MPRALLGYAGLDSSLLSSAAFSDSVKYMTDDSTSSEQPARHQFSTFEEALRDFKLAVENVPLAREVEKLVPHSGLYIPAQSRAYIAMVEPDGTRIIASINRGYAWVRDDAGSTLGDIAVREHDYWIVPFPTNSLHASGYSQSKGHASDEPICESCHTTLPSSGVCDTCG